MALYLAQNCIVCLSLHLPSVGSIRCINVPVLFYKRQNASSQIKKSSQPMQFQQLSFQRSVKLIIRIRGL